MEGYDPNTFYIHSSDRRGHSKASGRFSMPPDVVHRIGVFVADPRYPYETVQDFYRDSIVHRINELAKIEPYLDEVAHLVVRNHEVAAMIAVYEAEDNLVDNFRELARRMTTEQERYELIDEILFSLADNAVPCLHSSTVDKLKDLISRISVGAI